VFTNKQGAVIYQSQVKLKEGEDHEHKLKKNLPGFFEKTREDPPDVAKKNPRSETN